MDIKNLLKDLEDLYQRLVEDYNCGKPFEQKEEDRLDLSNAIELIKTLDK